MNRCTFMGNITHDLELKKVGTKGTSVLNFSIAVSRKYKNKEGESVKETTFINLEAWDSGAETIQRHFRKGKPIIVHCSAKTEKWTDKDGNNRQQIKFRVNEFDFVPDGNIKREEPVTDVGEGDSDGAGFATGDGGDDIPF